MLAQRRQCGSTGSPQAARLLQCVSLARSRLVCRLPRRSPTGCRTPASDELIDVGAETPFCHLGGIQISHRARRGVSWIRERRVPALLALLVDPLERRARQVDLAAYLQRPGRTVAQPQRDRLDHPHVRRDVFAPEPVAARDPAPQPSLAIAQRDAQAVDLQLGDVGHARRPLDLVHRLPDALIERPHLVLGIGILEAEHGRGMIGGLEGGRRPAGHALGR